MTWEIIIPLIAVGLSLMSVGIELLMHDREKAKKVEFAIKRKQREIKQLQKQKDSKAAMKANKELMSLMGKNFRLRMKTMLISFPLFIVLFFFLHGALNLAPLEAGTVSQVGAEVRNLAQSPSDVTAELVSDGVAVEGANARRLSLDDRGDQGDVEQVWWNVTASGGEKTYAVRATSDNRTDENSYDVRFVPAGSLTAGFEPEGSAELLDGKLEVKPLYKGVEINVFGINLPWFWYYLVTYFAIALAISPLKNRILWGHWKGVKHLEKLDREKNETAEKQKGNQDNKE